MESYTERPNKFNRLHSSCCDRVNILMENFQFFHRTTTEEKTDPKYIYPTGAYQQFSNWLRSNQADSASYLITGYRGAGKTGFVNYVIKMLNKEQGEKRFIPVSVSLGQENLNEIELLRIIAKKMFDKVYSKFCIINFFRWYLRAIIPIGAVFLLGVFLITCCVPSLKEAILEIWYIWIPTFCFLALLPWILKHLKAKEFNVFFRLKKLCLRLNATVTNERSMSFTPDIADLISKLGFSVKENIKNPPASIQEIEYELIEAFKELRGIERKEHYVIIFDELDKIDPKGSPAYRGGTEAAQDRKRQVLSIIANMKFFLSTAQAYFVFIAGREMYEAFQADMSDRDFSINSIFHGVLNIDSFLASSREINSVTAKTEEFVCRQLLPPDFEERARSSSEYSAGYTTHGSKPFTLKNYYRYRLLERFDFSGCSTFEEYRQYVWRDVWFLYHFISYLSFISNGSPKKLALFLEKYVRSEDYLETVKRPGSHRLMQGNGKGRTFYLSLGYYSMLKVNFIHHLTYPIIQNQVNRANMFGDKLLVAASFMISHLFKLHNNGFSWRNIEQMPELQEIDRTPEVREYIGFMIEFMNHSYLTTVPYGLFHYKFPMHICEEISFLSKLSGEAAALFNFTSGELQATQNRYAALLRQCAEEPSAADSEYTKASTHHSLGDLYVFEENFSAAIREYEQALELIPSPFVRNEKHWMEKNHLLFLNRTMLKLGLAHEKKHTDNSAYVVYNELIALLKECKKKGYAWAELLFRDTRTMHLALLAKVYVLEKLDTEGITPRHIQEACDDFDTLFADAGKQVKADFYRKLGDILYYKNARFKPRCCNKHPYTAIDCYKQSLQCLFDPNLILLAMPPNSPRFCAEVYWLAFYAKRSLKGNKADRKRDYYIYQLALACENMGHVLVYDSVTPSGDECLPKTWREFARSCQKFTRRLEEGEGKEIHPKNHFECSMYYYLTAAMLYNLSCERGLSANCYKETLQLFITYFRAFRQQHPNGDEASAEAVKELLDALSREELVALHRQKEHIYLSEENGIKWMKGLEMYEGIDGYDLSLLPEAEEFFYLYYTVLIELWEATNSGKTLSSISSFYNGALMCGKRPGQTLAGITANLKLKGKYNLVLLKRLIGFDIEAKSKYDPGQIDNFIIKGIDEKQAESLRKFFPSAETSLFHNGTSSEADEKTQAERMDLLDYLVTDTLFCFTRIVEMLTPLRNTTLFTNSYKASAFDRLQKFCCVYKSLYCYYRYGENKYKDKGIRDDKEINFKDWQASFKQANTEGRGKALFEQAARLTRKSTPSNTHIRYLAESAIHYYTRARQVHAEGKTYQEMIRSLYFLDDDLNNDTLQFYLAIERYSLNKGKIKNKEYGLKKRCRESDVYKTEWYFPD